MSDIASEVHSVHFEALASSLSNSGAPASIDMLMDVPLRVTVELGRTQMSVRQVLELQNGAVVELDRMAGEAVDVLVNDKLMARGEVVVVDDKFGIRITELISQGRREGAA
jgi:flagellar motor switch protein FliN